MEKELKSEPTNKLLEHFSDALSFDKMEERFATIATDNADTCKWIYETLQFQAWQDPNLLSHHHGFLWIKGKPGAGKSTIMKSIVMKAKEETGTGQIVLSFFFDTSGGPLVRSTEGMYRALLHQVLEHLPKLSKKVSLKDILAYKDEGWRLERLKDLFSIAVLQLASVKHVVCYVDALDEGGDKHAVRDMIEFMAELAETAVKRRLRFSVCVSSRHHPRVSITHSEELILEDQEDHKQAIISYIERKLKIGNRSLKLNLAKDIKAKAEGVFLWVVLVVRELNEEFDDGKLVHHRHIFGKLRAVPTDLQALFKEVLGRRKDQDGSLTASIQWVLYTTIPLSCVELYSAITFSKDTTTTDGLCFATMLEDSDSDVVDPGAMENMILDCSRGLVEISDKDKPVECSMADMQNWGIAQFIHESVKNYFLEGGLRDLDKTLSDNATALSYERLARWCHGYFLLVLDERAPELDKAADSSDQIAATCTSWPLLQYAVDSMLEYAEKATASGLRPCISLPNSLIYPWLLIRDEGRRKKKTCYPIRSMTTMLHILCDEGLFEMVVTELERVADSTEMETKSYVNTPCQGSLQKFGTALHIAVHTGSLYIVQFLIARGADPDAQCDLYGTPLCFAIQNGSIDIAGGLLLGGADPDQLLEGNGTALHLAIYKLDVEMVKTLLQHGANVNDQRGRKGTPIINAVLMKSETIVTLLLQHGADVRIPVPKGFDAVRYVGDNAVQYAKKTARRMLHVFSDHGIDVDADEFEILSR